jgi:2-polyprenyl-3-methyl-5-hydroxy-6-metoxy-1,4-benzoquinol methylase
MLRRRFLPFRNSSFDVIVAIELIEHLKKQRAFIDEVRRTLKTGGFILITTPNRLYSRIFRIVWDPTHMRVLSPNELAQLLSCFNVVVMQSSGIPFLNKLSEPFARKLARKLGKLLLHVMPFSGPSIWVVARKDYE